MKNIDVNEYKKAYDVISEVSHPRMNSWACHEQSSS